MGVPGKDQSLRDTTRPQECGRHQGHHPWRMQGLRVPGQRLWGHAHVGEELSQAGRGARLQALPSGGPGRGALSPGRDRAGGPEAPQVCLHRREKVRCGGCWMSEVTQEPEKVSHHLLSTSHFSRPNFHPALISSLNFIWMLSDLSSGTCTEPTWQLIHTGHVCRYQRGCR